MKKALFLLIWFFANQSKAQLKVEELTNDSLVKVFISQQTGHDVKKIYLPSMFDLKEKKQIPNKSKFDSVKTETRITEDFNNDGRLDLVVSYVESMIMNKYYFDFKIVVFVSNSTGGYDVKDIWQRYEHLLGRIIKGDSESRYFVIARQSTDFGKEVLRFDTLYYYQGEFINMVPICNKSFESVQYYTTSNWIAASSRYSYFTVFGNGTFRREDFDMGNKRIYQCQLKKEVFDSLSNLICAVNLWELNDRYEIENVHDAGTSHLVINYKGAVKKIDDYGHWGNFGLGALYVMIRRLSKDLDWILVEENTKKNEKQINKPKKMPGEN
ncbi:hypothetical protein IQ13_3361 [Lacibacter cauensis]|uniref:VCBS repeat protein n=1 Tax=Lacibacter cauensis TaxID=510947 RepID=A0A562SHI6_9BACT|nr:hypothetical protein [Lacibacter cauensis]TWI80682.1 hypothetical protein IQ13_3361 [Lacibacter cauensis]